MRIAVNMTTLAHCTMSKALEKNGRQRGALTWCAKERSPEAGAAKRRVREASESIKDKVPQDVIVESSGACWRKGGEWARLDSKECKWKQGGTTMARTTSGISSWRDVEAWASRGRSTSRRFSTSTS